MEKICTIENQYLRVRVARRGAELSSMFDKRSGKEQIWQKDNAIWKDSAPWLFPIVGRLKDDFCRWKGMRCAIPMHGFASAMPFELEDISDERMVWVLRDSEETRACYPAAFELRIAYTLKGAELHIQINVINPGKQELLFSIGAHPGFVSSPGDRLCFERRYDMALQRLNLEHHLLKPDVQALSMDSLILQEELFDEDAMIFTKPEMERISLCREDGTGITMDFGRVPWLGIWSRKRGGLGYVCIEPWFGVDDPLDSSGNLEEKAGIQKLEPGMAFEWHIVLTSL